MPKPFAAAMRVLRNNTNFILRHSLDFPAKRIANWLHHT